jgi:DNA-binding SARP family transcriptional activator
MASRAPSHPIDRSHAAEPAIGLRPDQPDRPGRHRVSITMFGRFAVQSDEAGVAPIEGRKVQELLSYLLLFRAKPHRREIVADALWGSGDTTQSRKYLRQAIWEFHGVFDGEGRIGHDVLLIDPTWIQVNPDADVWLDVAEIESAFDAARGIRGDDLDPALAAVLERAMGLYRGDLLEGWYQDWCLFERERLRAMYVMTVEKLLAYHESRQQFDDGFACGERILRQDRAHERTHWRLMRLRYQAGDRTGAMRQYAACVTALREELDVAPSERTSALYEVIRADRGAAPDAAPPAGNGSLDPDAVAEAAEPLQQALAALSRAERLVGESLRALRRD